LLFITIVNLKKNSKLRIYSSFYFIEYSLSGHKNMIMKINPDLIKAKHLRIWYDAGGRLSSNQIITNRPVFDSWKTIQQIENEKLGTQNRADYVMVKATCMHINNDRVVYMVC